MDEPFEPWWRKNNLLFWIVLDVICFILALLRGNGFLWILIALILVHFWRLEKRLNEVSATVKQQK